MEKTIKQIADELRLDKQRVYRYIKKNCIKEAHQEKGVMYYDDVAQSQIKQAFSKNEVHHEAHQKAHHDAVSDTVNEAIIVLLRDELEQKNEQINSLQRQLQDKEERHHVEMVKAQELLDQAQKLNAMDKQKILALEDAQRNFEEREKNKHWWQRFLGIVKIKN